MNKNIIRGLLAVGVLASAGASQAAGIDVTSVVSTITDQGPSIALVGAAVLAIFVGVKAFKWVRSALS